MIIRFCLTQKCWEIRRNWSNECDITVRVKSDTTCACRSAWTVILSTHVILLTWISRWDNQTSCTEISFNSVVTMVFFLRMIHSIWKFAIYNSKIYKIRRKYISQSKLNDKRNREIIRILSLSVQALYNTLFLVDHLSVDVSQMGNSFDWVSLIQLGMKWKNIDDIQLEF